MLRYKYNVAVTLAASMTDSAVTISLTPGDGAQLPVIASGTADTFLITVTDKNGNREIISICRRDSGSDTLYVGTGTSHQAAGSTAGRAQEGTTAIAVTYTDDHAISMCPTAEQFEDAVGGACPVGMITAYVPGYFTNGSNAGFTHQMISANTIAAVNAYLNQSGWYVCNGAAINDADSPIFNGASRYLPNLTDDRFLMGDTVAGGTGGANSNNIAHTHTTGDFTLTSSHIPSHTHTFTTASAGEHTHNVAYAQYDVDGGTYARGGYWGGATNATSSNGSHTHTGTTNSTGSGGSHNHGSTASGGNTALENRPLYLSCFYIMKVK